MGVAHRSSSRRPSRRPYPQGAAPLAGQIASALITWQHARPGALPTATPAFDPIDRRSTVETRQTMIDYGPRRSS